MKILLAVDGSAVSTRAARQAVKLAQKIPDASVTLFNADPPLMQAVRAPLPGPGVYARHDAVAIPALLPDGRPSDLSVSPVLERLRDSNRRFPQPSELEAAVEQAERGVEEGTRQ